MKSEYDDAMGHARATLAVLKRAAAELSKPSDDTEHAATVLHNLRDDLHRQDAPNEAQPARR